MIRTAVILAAGLGSRLGERGKESPKGFLAIDNTPIIEESIGKLIEQGFERIIIGTGHLREFYEGLARKYPIISCGYNEKFARTGSMYTLFTLKDLISEDFILLESDLIYDKSGLKVLNNEVYPDVILASGKTNSNDEVYIEVTDKGFLVTMDKDGGKLSNIYAELVGITRISYPTFQKMCAFSEKIFDIKPKLDYEQALVGIARDVNIYVRKIIDFAWCEIDDAHHLNLARSRVYPKIKERESLQSVKRNILLNPGPATTTDSVKYAQVVPDICPREKEFGDLMDSISVELTGFVANPRKYTTVLFCGSGTAVVEAILSSVIGKDERILIVNNGAYGKRMCQIAEVYNINYVEFKSRNDIPLDLDRLESSLRDSDKRISLLAVVHNETTTGLLNDIQAIGTICKRNNVKFIVDAMSSYAAIPIDMEEMNIGFLAASANKNLQGMPGIGFVIANREMLENTRSIRPRNFYLNLYAQYKNFSETKQMRFTPPVQILYALKQAILESRIEGVEARYARYSKSWRVLIEGIERLGLIYLVPKEYQSRIITAIVDPDIEGYNFNDMHDFFFMNGFTIYPGKLDNANTFRIANIGDITSDDVVSFVTLLEQYLSDIRRGRNANNI